MNNVEEWKKLAKNTSLDNNEHATFHFPLRIHIHNYFFENGLCWRASLRYVVHRYLSVDTAFRKPTNYKTYISPLFSINPNPSSRCSSENKEVLIKWLDNSISSVASLIQMGESIKTLDSSSLLGLQPAILQQLKIKWLYLLESEICIRKCPNPIKSYALVTYWKYTSWFAMLLATEWWSKYFKMRPTNEWFFKRMMSKKQ